MEDDKRARLERRERELRDDLKDVQETVLGMNAEEAAIQRRRDETRAQLKWTEQRRREVEQAHKTRQELLVKAGQTLDRDAAADILESRSAALDHERARLKAADEKIDAELRGLDERRRPFVQSQRRIVEQMEKCVDRQHQLHLNPHRPITEPAPMNPSPNNDFRQAAARPAQQAPASVSQIEQLKKRLDKPAPAHQLNPPGMSPHVGKHVRDNKAIGDEITRIQQAIANRNGQARGSFRRAARG